MVELPDHWYVDQTTLRILGIGLLMIIAVYLWFCAFAKHRHMTIKGQKAGAAFVEIRPRPDADFQR